MVEDLVVTHAVAATTFFQQIGRVGHAFHATGNHHVTTAGNELIMSQKRGLHARAAHFGERYRPRALRETAFETRLARRRLTLACHQTIAKQHFLHQFRLDTCALYSGLDGCATQVMGGQIRKITLKRAHGCAGGADDYYGVFVHGLSPSKMDRYGLPLQLRLLAEILTVFVSSPASPSCKKRLRSYGNTSTKWPSRMRLW